MSNFTYWLIMTFTVSKTLTQIRTTDAGEIHIFKKKSSLTLNSSQLALISLIIAQSSSLIVSYLMPEKAALVQAGTLTLSLALFLKFKSELTSKYLRYHLIEDSVEPSPTPQLIKAICAPKIEHNPTQENLRPLSLDERIDNILLELGKSMHRALCWKLIPHPTLFKNE